jgi:ABC-type branched-subunit amino acid transport system substrate-binding protein
VLARDRAVTAGARAERRAYPAARAGVLALLCAALALTGCGREYTGMGDARAAYARAGVGPVVIAAVEDPLGPSFVQGIELAVREINAGGGLLGRPVQIRRFPGGADLRQARRSAIAAAQDPRVSAVLGHRTSELAVPLSVIYERASVLFMPSFATAEQLTRHGFDFVLRTLPDNAAMAAQTASVAKLFGHARIAVLHSRDDYARELAFLFEDEARARGLRIVFGASFFAAETNYRGLLGQLNGVDFDAVYLSTEHLSGARLVRQLRELGFVQPVFGSDRLAYGRYEELAGDAGDRTVAPGVYDVHTPGPRNRAFVAAFRAAYDVAPDQSAAQGYDTARLFADIVRTAGSTEPRVLATTARYAPPRAGVTGIFAHDPQGNVYGKLFEFRVLRFDRWWPLPGVTAPYRLASFRAARQEMAREQAQQVQTPAPAPGAMPDVATAPEAAGNAAPSPVAAEPPPAADAERATAAAPDAEPDLQAMTSARLSTAERNRIWLTLAHEILGFERLGLVVPRTSAGGAAVGLARTLADARGFTVDICELPAPDAHAAEPLNAIELTRRERAGISADNPVEQAAVRCWTRLARDTDAMLVVPDSGLRPGLVRRLNRTLRSFGVPAFALAQSLDTDLGLTLALVASGVDLDDPQVALRFNGVLKGLRVSALNRQLTNLPAVSADLDAFAELGIRPDPRLLSLVSRAIEPALLTPAQTAPTAAGANAAAPAAGAAGAAAND